MTGRQRQLVERETQKLNLQIAEIKLDEIRLRKQVGDLEQEREDLKKQVDTRAAEVEKAAQEKEKVSDELAGAQAELRDLKADQSDLVARETQALHDELRQLKQAEADLRKQEELLKKEGGELEKTIQGLSKKLEVEARNREAVEKELSELQIAFDASQENTATLVKEQTHELREQIEQHKRNETELKREQASLKKEAEGLMKTIEARNEELAEARKKCEKAERELERAIDRASKGSREIEAQIADIKKEHRDEIERIRDEHKELRQSELHYRTLLQESADVFLQVDIKSGQIQWANQAAAGMFGEEEPEGLTAKTMDALSPERQPDEMPSADKAKARLHSALEAGHDSFEWQFIKGDGESFHALVSLSTIEVEEKELLLAVIKDVTPLKQRQADLEQAIAEAHAANALNAKVVDEVTETVETSLHPVVTSSTEIVKAENLTDEQKQDMAGITVNCRSLIDAMRYRSELSHMADGSDDVEPVKCDLHELIKSLDQQFAHRAETKSLFFAVSYAQYQSANNVPKFVETDEHKVQSVLAILLGYALAHTEKGRLGLHAARKSDQDETVTVAFELTYTGVEKRDELLSRVFDPDSKGAEDMQYGLTLAKRYVRLLGGDIVLEYRQSDITALTINLPFKKAASEIVMPGKNSAESKAGAA
jgi:signal transduction histidine kinase/predicted  nucleic acid-binding Zn-ribbon protein